MLQTTVHELMRHAAGMRILYVEDDAQIRENTRLLLSKFFPVVETAVDGKEGLEIYARGRFDIVVTDILMPRLNGITMLQHIKERSASQAVIVTSACEDSNYLLDLINLGVSQFILKPIQMDQLIIILAEVVKNIYNARKVREFTAHLEHELTHQTVLLEQYKEIVDLSAIVTKTDLDGKIIYANEAFCAMSGYALDELHDKTHHLLRHPESDFSVYDRLREAIERKQTWRGRLKSIKKDGGYCITETTVKPFLDEYGKMIECVSISFDVTEIFDLNQEIWTTQHELLMLLGEVCETRSRETGNHVRRVAQYSRLLAQLGGLGDEDAELIYGAAPMHDIGKIAIPDAILLKPGKLDADEFETMKTHTTIGHDLLCHSKRPLLQAAAVIARSHHERWDGSGYPDGRAGEEIPIYGRIVALADVFDALSCERVYKTPWPMDEIIAFVRTGRGTHFDPRLVDLLMAHIDRFTAIAEQLKD